ncbi:hypothetical protein AB1K56_03245 [Microbacterium sp. BWR-S6Y]|uniref:hypothetical protein n=1 Tax=Microbacterium sp. BWR-S6Y TaxID=3232073 RepID=UPI003528F4CD
MSASETTADVFRGALLRARASHLHGAALHVYALAEYERMRTFLTPDGLAGFALHETDIVSVFRHADSADRGVADALMRRAVAEGGRTLDAFDTYLPKVYARCGFVEIGRLAWDDKYAPADWDYSAFEHWNGGRPDVVLMRHDYELTA